MTSKGYLAIEEKHDKLITSPRTAYAEELNLKKEQTSYSDLLESLRLTLKGYQIEWILVVGSLATDVGRSYKDAQEHYEWCNLDSWYVPNYILGQVQE